jgi:hypothetical protein
MTADMNVALNFRDLGRSKNCNADLPEILAFEP